MRADIVVAADDAFPPGSDVNPGTLAQPFRAPQKMLDTLATPAGGDSEPEPYPCRARRLLTGPRACHCA
ncbi:hypothetical protein Msil_1283 [Methylocella silvestris BL2]|uniref:Uncharacterized protein n=1 Tax=Methylocella silvestris (strain DSM 15510 / CIP 108128 / LMG 27833 / NCIMB 13906 / BL2) TaxID=395965 RepID=B8ER68_METSB|nr:hypothetical protein Msil_1283 [Methylocella silvestris BL2]